MNSNPNDDLKNSQIIPIQSWREFQDMVASPKYQGWAFRGHADTRWKLESTLTRHLKEFGVSEKVWSHQEHRILRVFQRKANLFLQHIPDEDDIFEWLALMQHHGAPTRLLDFTWSPFVAAFFALEKAKNTCAVWAVSYKKINEANLNIKRQYRLFKPDQDEEMEKVVKEDKIDLAPRKRRDYNRYLCNEAGQFEVPFVAPGEPFIMNQRLIAQSGTFLVAGLIDRPVERILKTYPDPENTIVKFEFDTPTIRNEAMKSLYFMNVTNATLFPDLDGMARSLAYELEFHWGFNAQTGENFDEYLNTPR